jgi:hypothetical protein
VFSDWLAFFWPQVCQPWQLRAGVYNPPWLFVLMQPLRLLGPYGALLVLQLGTIIAVIKIGTLLKLSRFRIVMILLSPPVAWSVFMGQFDGLYLWAFLLPAEWAIIAALLKPQVGIGAAWEAVRRKPWVLAIGAGLLCSAWLIWRWPFSMTSPPPQTAWNWSFWPWGLVLLPLFLIRDWRGRLFAPPFLFPYAGLQSLVGPMLVIASLNLWLFIVAWLLSWVRWAWMVGLWSIPGL